jgi:hypothetical protein
MIGKLVSNFQNFEIFTPISEFLDNFEKSKIKVKNTLIFKFIKNILGNFGQKL